MAPINSWKKNMWASWKDNGLRIITRLGERLGPISLQICGKMRGLLTIYKTAGVFWGGE